MIKLNKDRGLLKMGINTKDSLETRKWMEKVNIVFKMEIVTPEPSLKIIYLERVKIIKQFIIL